MDRWTESYAPLFGRIFLGGFFVWDGVRALLHLPSLVDIFFTANVPEALSVAIFAASISVLGGILLVVDFKPRIMAGVLASYLLIFSVVLFMSSSPLGTQLFLEHMAVVGGLLYVMAFGSGPLGKK